jgi:hypothetical protein
MDFLHEKQKRFSWNLSIFLKPVETIKVSLKSHKNNGTLHEKQYTYLTKIRSTFFLEWEMFKKKSSTENQNTFYVQ